MTISKLQEHIGARIQGIDLTSPIDDATADRLRDALFRYSVLVFNNQAITDEQHVAFTRRLGPLYGERPLRGWWADQQIFQPG